MNKVDPKQIAEYYGAVSKFTTEPPVTFALEPENISMNEERKDTYDFDYITRSLGLIPIHAGRDAVNPGAIVCLETTDSETVITLHGGERFHLVPSAMIELEQTIRRREEEVKARQRENVKEQILAQHEIVQELNNRVQPGMIIGEPLGKRGRH